MQSLSDDNGKESKGHGKFSAACACGAVGVGSAETRTRGADFLAIVGSRKASAIGRCLRAVVNTLIGIGRPGALGGWTHALVAAQVVALAIAAYFWSVRFACKAGAVRGRIVAAFVTGIGIRRPSILLVHGLTQAFTARGNRVGTLAGATAIHLAAIFAKANIGKPRASSRMIALSIHAVATVCSVPTLHGFAHFRSVRGAWKARGIGRCFTAGSIALSVAWRPRVLLVHGLAEAFAARGDFIGTLGCSASVHATTVLAKVNVGKPSTTNLGLPRFLKALGASRGVRTGCINNDLSRESRQCEDGRDEESSSRHHHDGNKGVLDLGLCEELMQTMSKTASI